MYATAQQVRDVMADPDGAVSGTPGLLSDAVLLERVATAESQVDAAVSIRYVVPFPDPVPQLIVDITIAIASYLAALTYRKSLDLPATDPAALRYAWALSMLKALSTGDANIPNGPSPIQRPQGAYARNTYDGRLFTQGDFGLSRGYGGTLRRSPPYDDDWWR